MLSENQSFLIGLVLVPSLFLLVQYIFKKTTVAVEQESEIFVVQFGQVLKRFIRPGLHFEPALIWPWVKILRLSKQVDFRIFDRIQIDDILGTSLLVKVWVEFRIVDPYKVLFHIEDWENAFSATVTHALASHFSPLSANEIISDKNQLSAKMKDAIESETSRWGIEILQARIQKIDFLPELSKQMSEAVSAKINRKKALVEEQARLKVAELEARTSVEISAFNAVAKVQGAISISEAYSELSGKPKLLSAFQHYWKLSQYAPSKMVVIRSEAKTQGTSSMMSIPGITEAVLESAIGSTPSTSRNLDLL